MYVKYITVRQLPCIMVPIYIILHLASHHFVLFLTFKISNISMVFTQLSMVTLKMA
jgi:hypothetical protein